MLTRLSRPFRSSQRHPLIAALLCVGFVAAGCQSQLKTHRRAAIFTHQRVDHAGTTEDDRRIADNCGTLGAPEVDRRWAALLGPRVLVARDGYVLLHSSTDKVPLWVCEHLTPAEVTGSLERSDNFKPDPLLAKGARAELADYRSQVYDRGHMAPAANQMQDARVKDETFYLSNMVPQHKRLNQQIWKDLEEVVRRWAQSGELWTITGPMFYDPKEEDPTTADGIIDYFTIGPGDVAVPTHTYKIVARKRAGWGGSGGSGGGEDWECVAFVLANVNTYKKAPWNFAGFIKPVEFIEKRTGINFFPKLTDAEKAQVETTPGTLWP